MLLHTQGQTLPYLKFALSFRSAKIPPVVREQVIVRVGAVAECAPAQSADAPAPTADAGTQLTAPGS